MHASAVLELQVFVRGLPCRCIAINDSPQVYQLTAWFASPMGSKSLPFPPNQHVSQDTSPLL
eukprot:1159394-Pelagomonas_calceolata.AAC.21